MLLGILSVLQGGGKLNVSNVSIITADKAISVAYLAISAV